MKTRNEVENMTRKEAAANALYNFKTKNLINSYIIECFNGSFNELYCISFFNDKKINYLVYPDYVENKKGLDQYKEHCINKLNNKIFTIEELKTIENYQDYEEKRSFIWNIMCQFYDTISLYDEKVNEIDTNIFHYKCFMKLWSSLEDLRFVKSLYLNLETLYTELIRDDKKFYDALVYEMFNHESPIDWDGVEPALNALGLTLKGLTQNQLNIVNKAYKYVCNAVNW